jgi:CarboxypepD_reg-like domain
MKTIRFILVSILAVLTTETIAQQSISGTVSDQKGNPVSYANIYFEGSYEGTITDTNGHFELRSELKGEQLFTVSFIGFETYNRLFNLRGKDTILAVVLKNEMSEINELVITAGVFSASDEKKSATLSSFDIASTASAVGDIYGAYATMPGSQKVGEEGMLFVRGGEAYETKTYMDGMLVQSPFFSSMPDVPTRGRFSPLLFSETLFSTGGYSAEYGHALSSIVDLTSNGLEPEDKASVALMSVGANASWAKRWEKSSLAVTGLYANNALHHKLFKQNVDWTRDPVLGDGMMMFRQQIGENGLLKSFCSFNTMSMEMNYDNFETGTMDPMSMVNLNLYANSSYTDQLAEKWLIRTGIAYSRDSEKINYKGLPVTTLNRGTSVKLTFTHLTSKKFKTRFGGDLNRGNYSQLVTSDSTITMELNDYQPSLFLETEWKISRNLALRTGVRAEYSSLLREPGFLPRLSAAYKTGNYSQFSFAWGKYRQKPENEILQFAPSLSHEHADHYILNFQYRKQHRTFRVEGYVKQYKQLAKFTSLYSPFEADYNNQGSGSAQGFDLFWRDSESLKGSDYWISYSFLNTSRDYRDYTENAVPSFASAHNLSVVYKRFFTRLKTFGGITYSFASGRPYNDINTPDFMSGRTKAYHDISLNLTYVTSLFDRDCIIHLNITNALGFKNIYGYRFASSPDESGTYPSQAVVPTTGTQAILMFMLSL